MARGKIITLKMWVDDDKVSTVKENVSEVVSMGVEFGSILNYTMEVDDAGGLEEELNDD